MIRVLDDVEGGARQFLEHSSEQIQLRQVVARSLQEEHGEVRLAQVRRALDAGPLCRMEGKADEAEAEHPGERAGRLGLRGHAPAEGLASREEGQPMRGAGRHRLAHARVQDFCRVDAAPTFRHVGEVVAKGRHPLPGERVRERLQERMAHAGARPVSEDEEAERVGRHPRPAQSVRW